MSHRHKHDCLTTLAVQWNGKKVTLQWERSKRTEDNICAGTKFSFVQFAVRKPCSKAVSHSLYIDFADFAVYEISVCRDKCVTYIIQKCFLRSSSVLNYAVYAYFNTQLSGKSHAIVHDFYEMHKNPQPFHLCLTDFHACTTNMYNFHIAYMAHISR